MKHGIIYCRVSSKEQIEGTSLESQELACREFARTQGIAVLKIFVGRGESAKFADRPELLELLDYCRRHRNEIDTLLVWKLDRLARNVNDHFNIKATLLKYGITVVSVTEPIGANPEGNLLETILAGFAQFDNDVRAMRTVQGMRRKLQEGIFPWKPPLGYRSPQAATEKKLAPDEPDQPVFGLLQRAWKSFATGAYTKAEIKRLMTNWGILTRKGEPISDQSLDNLFRNRYYAGVLIDPWSGEESEGKHLPMVTREEFARVQQTIEKRNRSLPHHRIRDEFPLRGTVRCPACTRYMTSSFSRGRRDSYPYYRCINRQCGNGKSYAAAAVHDEFRAWLSSITPKEELISDLQKTILAAAEERQRGRRAHVERQKDQASRISGQVKQLIAMRAQNLITDNEFLAEKKALVAKQDALEGASRDLGVSVAAIREHMEKVIGPLGDLASTWDRLTAAEKQRFHQRVLPVGFVTGQIGTAELGLLFRFFRQSEPPISHGVPPTVESWNQLLQEIKAFASLFDHSKDEENDFINPVRTIS